MKYPVDMGSISEAPFLYSPAVREQAKSTFQKRMFLKMLFRIKDWRLRLRFVKNIDT